MWRDIQGTVIYRRKNGRKKKIDIDTGKKQC